MLSHVRRFSPFLIVALAFGACDDEPDPTAVVIGLPTDLNPIAVSTPKNTPVEATVLVSSIEGRTLSYSVTSGPSNGTATLTEFASGVRVSYAPAAGFAGADQVTFRVADGVSTVDGEVNITVTNLIPTVQSVSMRRPAVGPFTVEVSGSDDDGDALTFEIVDGPANGSVSAFSPVPTGPAAAQGGALTTRAQVTYTPDDDFLGDESFTFRANDGNDPSQPATISLTANRLPEGEIDGGSPVTVRRNALTRISIDISDADLDPVTPTVATDPTNGTLGEIMPTLSGLDIFYTPTPGFVGDDSFSLSLDDGFDVVDFVVDLTVVNEPPVAFNAQVTGFVGSDVAVDLSAADPDDDPLTFEIVGAPAEGSLGDVTSTGPMSGRVVYSPGAAGPGPQTFTFRVTDGVDVSNEATVTVQLITETPIATGNNVITPEDTPVDITLTGIDQQGDALTFAIAQAPVNGTLSAITPAGPFTAQVTYTPNPDFNGADFFTFTVSDGVLTSLPGDIGVSVTPASDPPTVVGSPSEAFTTHTNVQLEVAAASSVTPGVFVAGDLLSNFTDPDGDPLTISLEAGTVTAGATVTLNPDGTFIYTPPVGRTADDTFDYTVTDGETPVTRTVTVSFGPAVWFVDDTFAGVSDGTSAAPFTTLGAASAAASPNDIVFVRRGNSGTTPLAGGFVFQAGMSLVGEASGLTTGLGVVAAPSGGGRPVITNAGGVAATLADGVTLDGFDISSPTGAGILASAVAGVTVSNVDITNAGGPGVDLDAPTGVVALTSVVVVDAAGAAIDIDGGSATVTSDGAITNSAGRSVEVSGVTGGSVELSGDIADTGAGIQIDGNTGGTITLSGTSKVVNVGANPGVTVLNNTGATIAFTGGGLDVDVTSGAGFAATGGGTVTVEGTGNSVLSTTGTAVDISNTTIGAAGVAFQRVDANGATNGIVLDDTGAGAFTVSGTGTTDGSGGTITATTGDGVVLTSASAVSLANMIIGDAAASAGQAPDATNAVAGDGIVATDVTGLTLNNVLVSRTADHGIDGTRVTTLSVTNSEFLNNGDGAGDDALHFGASGGPDGLFGTSLIANTVLDGFAEAGLEVHNATGSLSLTVTGGSFGNNQAGIAAGIGTHGISLVPVGSASITASVSGTPTFASLSGAGVNGEPDGSAVFDLTVNGGSFNDTDAGTGAVSVQGIGSSSTRVAVTGNTILAAAGSGIYLVENGGATLDATVSGNTVGSSGVVASGAQTGNGVSLIHAGTGTSRFLVDSNILHSHDAAGILSLNLEAGAAADVDSHVQITGNTVAAPENAGPLGGIQVSTAADHTLCTAVTGNTSAGVGGSTGIEIQQDATSVFGIVGLTASGLAADAFLASVNTSTAAELGGAYVDAGGSCTSPTAPATP